MRFVDSLAWDGWHEKDVVDAEKAVGVGVGVDCTYRKILENC